MENTNVFTLAQTIVHSTPCRPTIQLCARVALMVSDCSIYLVVIPSKILTSTQFSLSAMAEKNTGTLSMQDSSSFDPGQVLQPLN